MLMGVRVDDLISFSLRIPKALAASIEATAKRLGVSKSEYARRAMEEFEGRLMQERIAELSRQLAAHSASGARSMEGSTSDGLE
jgi:Ribbon-helix-helix protein, copG family